MEHKQADPPSDAQELARARTASAQAQALADDYKASADRLRDTLAGNLAPAREPLSAYAHEAWAAYMDYFLNKCLPVQQTGALIVPAAYVAALRRQIATPYAELHDAEKDGDRAEADKMIAVFLRAARAQGEGSTQDPVNRQKE